MKQQLSNDRKNYIDFLRFISIVAVIMLHVSAIALQYYSIETIEWNVSNFYSSISRFAVPIFVMISGAIFLRREIHTRTIYKKYIPRLVVAYIVFYTLYNVVDGIEHRRRAVSVVKRMMEFEDVPYHLWYIVMIIGIYMVYPIIKTFIENKKITKYFLVLSLVFSFALPQTLSLVRLISTDYSKILIDYSYNLCINLPIGYTGYFVLGYILSETNIDKKKELVIYIFGIVGFILSFFYQYLNDSILCIGKEPLYDYLNINLTINVLLQAVAVFVFFKNHYNPRSKCVKGVVYQLSSLSFGVYLFHLLFLIILEKHFAFLTPLESNPIFTNITTTILVLSLSLCSTYILKKVPFVKKLF